jgi:hypothetical protein
MTNVEGFWKLISLFGLWKRRKGDGRAGIVPASHSGPGLSVRFLQLSVTSTKI